MPRRAVSPQHISFTLQFVVLNIFRQQYRRRIRRHPLNQLESDLLGQQIAEAFLTRRFSLRVSGKWKIILYLVAPHSSPDNAHVRIVRPSAGHHTGRLSSLELPQAYASGPALAQ